MSVKKQLRLYANLPRLAPVSHFRSEALKHPPLSMYSPLNFLAWMTRVGRYWFSKKHVYPIMSTPIALMPSVCRIGIAGDWGSGTDEAAMIATRMQRAYDYTVHLGDVYFVGSCDEVNENFLGLTSAPGMPGTQYEPVAWPRGTRRTFALCGNHDMYSNGDGYFDVLLPWLQQTTPYFRLENDNWVVLGLDTGYNSTGIDFGPVHPSCAFPDVLINWLRARPIDEKKSVIVMTHHQPISAFDTAYPTPAKQLAEFVKRPFIWIWGHEHRMAVYDFCASPGGVNMYGFCCGHGGMPVELKSPSGSPRVLFTDMRPYAAAKDMKVGLNGYMDLCFSGNEVKVNFFTLAGTSVCQDVFMNHEGSVKLSSDR